MNEQEREIFRRRAREALEAFRDADRRLDENLKKLAELGYRRA